MSAAQRNATTTVLAALIGIAVGAIAVLGLRPTTTPSELGEPADSPEIAISLSDFSDPRELSVEVRLAPSAAVVAPDAGIVTKSTCARGQAISSGSSPYAVSGRPLLALQLAVPLWRDLSIGSHGDDVRAVQQEFRRLGHAVPETGQWDPPTRDAVTALLGSIGLERGSGDLLLTDVIWLPTQDVKPADCPARVGDRIDAGGDLATITPTVVGLVVPLSTTELLAGERQLQLGSVTTAVPLDGVITDAAVIEAALLDPSSAPTLATLESGSPLPLTGRLALTTPRQVANVPASAVRSGPAGPCVFDTQSGAVPVEVLGSSLGTSIIEFTASAAPRLIASAPDTSDQCE